jgi:uncharacterized protein (TIGR03000 family)
MFRKKLAVAILLATLMSSVTADQSDARWHTWGYGYYPYAVSYRAVYPTVVVAPTYHAWAYRPVLGHRWGRWGHWRHRYYVPVSPWYGGSCCWAGCGISHCHCVPHCYTVTPHCCEGVVVDSQRPVVPSEHHEPTPADEAPAPPPSEMPPADAPPPEPAEPDIQLPELPETPMSTDPAQPDLPVPPQPDPVAPDSLLPLLPGDQSMDRPATGSATLTVRVPVDARVTINDRSTRTTGTYRQYISRGLVPGSDYTYEVRVDVVRDGRTISDVRTVNLRAGGSLELAFRMDRQPAAIAARDSAATSLTLHVPESARVILEGQSTEVTGGLRRFVTRELNEGQRWEDYRVVVEFEQDGQVQTSVKTIDLVAGGDHELSFDFLAPRVASR